MTGCEWTRAYIACLCKRCLKADYFHLPCWYFSAAAGLGKAQPQHCDLRHAGQGVHLCQQGTDTSQKPHQKGWLGIEIRCSVRWAVFFLSFIRMMYGLNGNSAYFVFVTLHTHQ